MPSELLSNINQQMLSIKMEKARVKDLKDILSEEQVQDILNKTIPGSQLIGYNLKPATQGLAGFLGDHFRLALKVKDGDTSTIKSVFLFVKALPTSNKPKADFIDENNYFRRESLMFNLFDEMPGHEGPNAWRTTAYVHSEKILVMPDLAVEGYKVHPVEKSFDKNHVLATVTSLARFHAAFSNMISKKVTNFLNEYGNIMEEPTFKESPWLSAGAKLTNSFLREFSNKWKDYPENLSDQLQTLFTTACGTLRHYDETLNVVIHKDLWANNVLFKYQGDVPTNAVLIDFQCMRYGPPAFDVMIFLYLVTSRRFRDDNEKEILDHYFTAFSENIACLRLQNYGREDFLVWCDKARLFGLIEAALICPFVLMSPIAAQKYFDNPDTFMEYLEVDRSYPVISYASDNDYYRNKLLEVYEELVEKFILTNHD